MKSALVVNPTGFRVMGGGELVCLHTIKALQDLGYHVGLATDRFRPEEVELQYGNGLGKVMEQCDHVPVEGFRPKARYFTALQRLEHARKTRNFLEREKQKVVFYTQSAIHLPLRNRKTFQFVYDVEDLQVPELISPRSRYPTPYNLLLKYYRRKFVTPEPERTFLALSSSILERLQTAGYTNSQLVLPPVASVTKPGKKLKRVIQVTRVVPQKRLEILIETARRLPDYEFYIVSRTDQQYREYKKQLLSRSPSNVRFVERHIREVPELLSNSRVYFYTSLEPGVNIAAIEGLLAGCYPVCPSDGGGAEIVRETGIGATFATIEEAVANVRSAMEIDYSPADIFERGKHYSPEYFEERIKIILTESSDDRY